MKNISLREGFNFFYMLESCLIFVCAWMGCCNFFSVTDQIFPTPTPPPLPVFKKQLLPKNVWQEWVKELKEIMNYFNGNWPSFYQMTYF